eukprot:15485557-Alexandrium_andersonii.AAC.1
MGPLLEWLQTGPMPNQRDAVGIFKASLLVRPSASMQQRQLVEDTMSFVVRPGLQDTSPYEVSFVSPRFDLCLQACWPMLQKTSQDPVAFWERSGGIAKLAMGPSDATATLQEKPA